MSTQVGKVEQDTMNKTPEALWDEIEEIHTSLIFGISALDVIGMATDSVNERSIGDTTEVLKIYFKDIADKLSALLA